jgi:hypothetical protein
MQHLLSRARVDERQLLDAAADWAAAHLTAGQDEEDVVLIVDETADEVVGGLRRRGPRRPGWSAGRYGAMTCHCVSVSHWDSPCPGVHWRAP